MRIRLYNNPPSLGGVVWKDIKTGYVQGFSNTPTIQTKTIGDTVIKYFTNSLINCSGVDPEKPISDCTDNQTTYPDTSSSVSKYTNGKLVIPVSSWVYVYGTGTRAYAAIRNLTYNNEIIVSGAVALQKNLDIITTKPACYINAYELEINQEKFIYFSTSDFTISGTRALLGFGISANAFEGSEVPRFVPPTEPDEDGGYGTGSTPSGNQDGSVVNVDVGGDTVNVAPPNVTVDVHVNMPEINAPQINHPDGINIALVSNTALGFLNDALWGRTVDAFNNLWLQFQNYSYDPMKAIISCIKLPLWVTRALNSTSSIEQDIGVAGTTIPSFRGKKIDPAATVRQDFYTGPLTQFNTFQDYVGVTVRAYAPFVGWFELDPSLCLGVSGNEEKCKIKFEYTVDATNGNVGVSIWAYTAGKSDTQTHGVPIASGSGNCAYPVLLSANDRGISDVVGGFTQIIGGLTTMAAGAVTGNAPLAIGGGVGMFNGVVQGALAQQHTTTVGGVSGNVGYLNYLIPFVMVIKPRYSSPARYNAIYGRPSYADGENGTVSDFEGHWAQLDVHCENFGFANEREQKLIVDALAKGVYV